MWACLTPGKAECCNASMAPDIEPLGTFLSQTESLVVLSGAGVSTGSGIPDYRDRNGEWKFSQPIQFNDFMGSAASRQRYWARSYVGWMRFSVASPNPAHHALARLEESGKVDTLITQNVDGLHAAAGSRKVIDLHGDLSKVRCMECATITERADFQVTLRNENVDFHAEAVSIRADGDAEIREDSISGFSVPNCESCGGVIKPDVVMFGEGVPRQRVQDGMDAVERADALLVVGSSLMVFSGYRFARRADEIGKRVVIVNQGKTRADDIAEIRIDEDCSRALTEAVDYVLD